MDTDEMGNGTEEIQVWYLHASCVTARMSPIVSVYESHRTAEIAEKVYRKNASTWACVYLTGPHPHVRPKPGAIMHGHRAAVAADFGLEAA